MILKDKRLLACGDMCTGGAVCDIGTDHGYLPAYLLDTGKCSRAIAADINPMPLDAARNTFAKAGLTDKAEFYLSDGLNDVPLEGITDIVIAGMGGELIASILAADSRTKSISASFILQPMTRAGVLRRFLAENGFEVNEERAVSDGRFVYSVMKCRYNGKPYEIDSVRENIGIVTSDYDDGRLYISRQLERIERAAKGMAERNPHEADTLMKTAVKIRKEAGL